MPKLRFGAFLAPHHPIGENPFLQFQSNLEFVEMLDRLGYEEFWCGEHHSTGWEMIASPELFLAAVAERTHRIMLGTGVVSLPTTTPSWSPNESSNSTGNLAAVSFSVRVPEPYLPTPTFSGLIQWSKEIAKTRRWESSASSSKMRSASPTNLTGSGSETQSSNSDRCKTTWSSRLRLWLAPPA